MESPPMLKVFAGRMGHGKDTAAEFLMAHGFVRVALADEIKRLARPIFDLTDTQLFGPSAERNKPFETPPSYWEGVFARIDEHRAWITDLFRDAPEPLFSEPVNWLRSIVDAHVRGPTCSTRTILQKTGTEWGRFLWENVWVHYVGHVFQMLATGGWVYTATRGLELRDGAPRCSGVVITDARFSNELQHAHTLGGTTYWVDASRRLPPTPENVTDAQKNHASEPEFVNLQPDIDKLLPNNGTLDEFAHMVLSECLASAEPPGERVGNV